MKKTFRFMAMALAAVVMAGAAVSCDPMDNDDENTEQTDDTQNGDSDENEGTGNEGEGEGNENEGTGNEGETVTLTLDGKQWMATVPAEESENGEESGYCFDFGVTVEGKYLEGGISFNTDSPAYYKFTADATMYAGEYTIEPANATSGTIVVVSPSWGESEYLYKELTATSVKIQKMSYDWAAGPDDYATFNIPEITITVQE